MERLSYYRPLFNIFKISCVKGENVNWCSKSKGTRSPQLHGVHQYHEHWSRYWCYIIIRILSYNLSAHSHYIHTTDDYWSKMEVNIEVFGHKHLNIWSDRPVQHIHITFHSSLQSLTETVVEPSRAKSFRVWTVCPVNRTWNHLGLLEMFFTVFWCVFIDRLIVIAVQQT